MIKNNLSNLLTLISCLAFFSAFAQRDTSFVVGDTIVKYGYWKSGKPFYIIKYLRGRDYETYQNEVFFDEGGDTANVFFEDKFTKEFYMVSVDKHGNKRVTLQDGKTPWTTHTYNRQGQLLKTIRNLKKENLRISTNYKNGTVVSTDSSILIEQSKSKKVYRLKTVDTIHVQYPELVFEGNGFVDAQGKRILDVCYYMDSLILEATKNAPRLYYLKGSKPLYMTQNSKSGLYRKGHIPYQGFWRFRHTDTILYVYPPIYLNSVHGAMVNGRYLNSTEVKQSRDSLVRNRTKYATHKYYLKEYSFNSSVYREGEYKKGHIPAGVYIENHRCGHHVSNEKFYRYKVKGQYNRKGQKDGTWKEYEYCTGLFHYEAYYKNGKLIWQHNQYL